MSTTDTITVTRSLLTSSFPGRRPSNYYECTGPDDTRYTNDSIVTLRTLLRRRYPGARIVEGWR